MRSGASRCQPEALPRFGTRVWTAVLRRQSKLRPRCARHASVSVATHRYGAGWTPPRRSGYPSLRRDTSAVLADAFPLALRVVLTAAARRFWGWCRARRVGRCRRNRRDLQFRARGYVLRIAAVVLSAVAGRLPEPDTGALVTGPVGDLDAARLAPRVRRRQRLSPRMQPAIRDSCAEQHRSSKPTDTLFHSPDTTTLP